MDRTWIRKVIRDISNFGQIGFSMITPPIILCGIAYFLNDKYNIGQVYIILALIIGILTGFVSALKVVSVVLAKATKEQKENSTISFNKHF